MSKRRTINRRNRRSINKRRPRRSNRRSNSKKTIKKINNRRTNKKIYKRTNKRQNKNIKRSRSFNNLMGGMEPSLEDGSMEDDSKSQQLEKLKPEFYELIKNIVLKEDDEQIRGDKGVDELTRISKKLTQYSERDDFDNDFTKIVEDYKKKTNLFMNRLEKLLPMDIDRIASDYLKINY